MTDYTKVYDPKGKMFEIPHERAALLVLNNGWSWNKPEPVKEEPVAAPEPAPVLEPVPAPQEPETHEEYSPPKKKTRLN